MSSAPTIFLWRASAFLTSDDTRRRPARDKLLSYTAAAAYADTRSLTSRTFRTGNGRTTGKARAQAST